MATPGAQRPDSPCMPGCRVVWTGTRLKSHALVPFSRYDEWRRRTDTWRLSGVVGWGAVCAFRDAANTTTAPQLSLSACQGSTALWGLPQERHVPASYGYAGGVAPRRSHVTARSSSALPRVKAPGPANRPCTPRRRHPSGQHSESEETGPHAWVAWNSGVGGSIDDTDPFAAEPCWLVDDGDDDLPVSASR